MKKLTIFFMFFAATSLFGQTYTLPTDLSPYGVASWVIEAGNIASDSAAPTLDAATGALYVDISTPTSPLLYRFDGSAWRAISGAGSGEDLAAHIASQTDPHGATMAVTLELTIGSGTADAELYSIGDETLKIASYVALPFDVEPSSVASENITLWADDASKTLQLHDGTEWHNLLKPGIGLPTYADNAAAISGGLVAGDLYKTSVGAVMVVY